MKKILSITLVVLGLAVTGQFIYLLFTGNFNWDETNANSLINGWFTEHRIFPFRNGIIYPLFWIPLIPGGEFGHLIVARCITVLCGTLPTIYFSYRILQKMGSGAGSDGNGFTLKLAGLKIPVLLFLVLFFLFTNFGYLETAFNFRTDGIAAGIFMWVLYVTVFRGTAIPVWSTGLALGFSLFLNTKGIYFTLQLGAVWLGLLWLRNRRGEAVKDTFYVYLRIGLVTATAFILLSVIHILIFDFSLAEVVAGLKRNAQTGFGRLHGAQFKIDFFFFFILRHVVLILVLPFALVWACFELFRNKVGQPEVAEHSLTGLVLALTAVGIIFVHQGMYKYMAINIIPCFIPLLFIGFQKALTHRVITAVLLVVVGVTGFQNYSRLGRQLSGHNKTQKQLIDAVQKVFPEKVIYSDGVGFIASYFNSMRFLSHKKLLAYREGQYPLFQDERWAEYPPAFIIGSKRLKGSKLLPADRRWLQANYHRLAYPFWLRRIQPKPEKQKIAVTSWYRPMGKGVLSVDGNPVTVPVRLTAKEYVITCTGDCENTFLVAGKKDLQEVLPLIWVRANRKEQLVYFPKTLYYNGWHNKKAIVYVDGKELPRGGRMIETGWHFVRIKPGKFTPKYAMLSPLYRLFDYKFQKK